MSSMADAPRARRVAAPDPAAEQLSKRAWGMLLVLCGALFLDATDVAVIGVALPSIREDLGLSSSSAAS